MLTPELCLLVSAEYPYRPELPVPDRIAQIIQAVAAAFTSLAGGVQRAPAHPLGLGDQVLTFIHKKTAT